MTESIFTTNQFRFPYLHIRFPGQASDETILFVTRESQVMLQLRLLQTWFLAALLFVTGLVLPWVLQLSQAIKTSWHGLTLIFALLSLIVVIVGSWWSYWLWRRSLFILTNRRLTKFIFTTPWTRYQLSLTLDKIVDTGSYTRGFFQTLFRLGTFTARSSAGNRANKYFYIENVEAAEDLANYVNKLLFHFERNLEKLDSFRPFLPRLKGDRRKQFMKKFPQYWS